MSSLTLRTACTGDSEFAYGVKRAAFREYVESLWGWDEVQQRQLHQRRFETQEFRIINWNGVDVGIVAVVVTSDCLKVNQMFLLPEYQNRGIGSECMRRVIGEACQLGLPVRLRVLKVNPRALMFYRRLGFISTEEDETHFLMENRR